jgi:hypothetical protein
MPEIGIIALRQITELILDLKARLEAAEAELKRLQADPASLEKEHKLRVSQLGNIPKVAWIRSHFSEVDDRALRELEQVLRSRK